MKAVTINACWHNLWPQLVKNLTGFPDNTAEKHAIIGLAWQVGGEGFDNMQLEELEALIESHAEELTEEELEAITKASKEEEAGNGEEEVPTSKLTVKFLGKVLQGIRSIAERVQDANPVMECYLRFKMALDDALLPYRELHKSLQQSVNNTILLAFSLLLDTTSTLTCLRQHLIGTFIWVFSR